MIDHTPSELNFNALGVYDGFDTVVSVRFSRSDINDPNIAQHVAGHEQSHFFQNFFTLQGLSYYQVVRFIESLTEDLLLAWGAPIPIPAIKWLQTSPKLKDDVKLKLVSSTQYYDRYFRLFNQLGTAHPSVHAVKDWASNTGRLNMAICLQDKAYTLNVPNRTFVVGKVPVFQIDYSAICESMSKAMEYFNHMGSLAQAGLDGTPPRQEVIDSAENKVLRNAALDMDSPHQLNYTFPLLYLRQSGYNLQEAIHLTIVLGYVALMNNISKASLPEIGADRMVKFGTIASDVYAQLLQCAYEDKFLPVLNRLLTEPNSFSNIVDYLDEIAMIGGANKISVAQDVLQQYSDSMGKMLHKRGFPRNLWFIRILECAKEYCNKLKTRPAIEGLSLLLSPMKFLYDSNIGPTIICSDGVAFQMNNVESVIPEIATFSASLNFVKTLLFGWKHLRISFGETGESAKLAFSRYLQQFGVDYIEGAP